VAGGYSPGLFLLRLLGGYLYPYSVAPKWFPTLVNGGNTTISTSGLQIRSYSQMVEIRGGDNTIAGEMERSTWTGDDTVAAKEMPIRAASGSSTWRRPDHLAHSASRWN